MSWFLLEKIPLNFGPVDVFRGMVEGCFEDSFKSIEIEFGYPGLQTGERQQIVDFGSNNCLEQLPGPLPGNLIVEDDIFEDEVEGVPFADEGQHEPCEVPDFELEAIDVA